MTELIFFKKYVSSKNVFKLLSIIEIVWVRLILVLGSFIIWLDTISYVLGVGVVSIVRVISDSQ